MISPNSGRFDEILGRGGRLAMGGPGQAQFVDFEAVRCGRRRSSCGGMYIWEFTKVVVCPEQISIAPAFKYGA